MSRDTDFEPNLAILPDPRRNLWGELRAIPPSFTLYGGTAREVDPEHLAPIPPRSGAG
jgi:hypothetical protein